MSPTPKDMHQDVVGAIYFFLKQYTLQSPENGQVKLSPLDVHLDNDNVIQPDVFWVSGPESRCQLGEDGYWHGAPDLVVEVISPGTERRDRREKFALYEQHGTREYWLVNPQARFIEVWRLEDGHFVHQGIYGPEDSFEVAVLGERKVEGQAIFAGD